MKKYYIIAESGADLSPELIEKHGILIAPMHLSLDDIDYVDGAIKVDEICEYHNRTGKIPKTSAAAPFEYVQLIEKIKTENPNAIIIHIGYSAVLSSSFQNSLIAGEGHDRIYHINSKNVSIGQAYIVAKAAELIEDSPDIPTEDLVSSIEEIAEKTKFWFIPGDLKFLRAGGRVSNIKSIIATLLHIKPLLELVDGKMVATKNYRGTMNKVALKVISDFFERNTIDMDSIFIGHTHTIDPELKENMIRLVKQFGAKNVSWFKAGAVITSHAGPGGFGIVGLAL